MENLQWYHVNHLFEVPLTMFLVSVIATFIALHWEIKSRIFIGLIASFFALLTAFVMVHSRMSGVPEYQEKLATIQSIEAQAARYKVPLREEMNYLVGEMNQPLKSGLLAGSGQLTPLFRSSSHRFIFERRKNLLSADQHAIFDQYLAHCYQRSLSDDRIIERLQGYPVTKQEAQSTLEHLQANASKVNEQCLVGTASLSFLEQ